MSGVSARQLPRRGFVVERHDDKSERRQNTMRETLCHSDDDDDDANNTECSDISANGLFVVPSRDGLIRHPCSIHSAMNTIIYTFCRRNPFTKV